MLDMHEGGTKGQEGFASIVVVMVLVIIMALLATSFAQLARREQQTSLNRMLGNQAYYAAESGLNDIMNYIKNNPSSPLSSNPNNCINPANYGLNNQVGNSSSYTCMIVNIATSGSSSGGWFEAPSTPANRTQAFGRPRTAGTPFGLAYDPVHKYIWYSNGGSGNTVGYMDTSGNQLGTVSSGGSDPIWLAYDPVHNYVVTANWGTSTLGVVNLNQSPYTAASYPIPTQSFQFQSGGAILQPVPNAPPACQVPIGLLGNNYAHPVAVVTDPNGNAWLTLGNYWAGGPGCVVVMNPTNGQTLAEYAEDGSHGCFTDKMTAVPDDPNNPQGPGRMFFTVLDGQGGSFSGGFAQCNSVPRAATKGIKALYSIKYPGKSASPSYAPDCSVSGGPPPGCITPVAHTNSFTPSEHNEGIAYDAINNRVYYSDSGDCNNLFDNGGAFCAAAQTHNNQVCYLDLNSDTFSCPSGLGGNNINSGAYAGLDDMTVDPTGKVWVAESHGQNATIAAVDPQTNTLKEYTDPNWTQLTIGSNGQPIEQKVQAGAGYPLSAPYGSETTAQAIWVGDFMQSKISVLDKPSSSSGSTSFIDVTGKSRNVLKRIRATIGFDSNNNPVVTSITSLPPVL